MSLADRPSLENYLHFLRLFRGTVTERAGSIRVASERREFTLTIPVEARAGESLPDAGDGSILSLPWAAWVEPALGQGGFHRQAEIVFLAKPTTGAASAAAGIRVARSLQEVEDFSLVQSRGFLEDEPTFEDWYPWLRAANLRNHDTAECHFLVAEHEGRPAAVALVVESPRACGIYAVATPPERRRRGLSTSLLGAAEGLARERGHASVCLQVYAGTYAHAFYGRRGFSEEYRVGLWSREDPAASH